MEARARGKYILGSARKIRLVADLVRSKPINQAIGILHEGLSGKGSHEIERIVRSAVANLQNRNEAANVDIDDLKVKTICIDVGPTLKRGRPRAQGRYYRRLRRSFHITVTVSD